MKPIDFRGTVISVSYSTTVDILTDVLSESLAIHYILEVKRKNESLTNLFSLNSHGSPFQTSLYSQNHHQTKIRPGRSVWYRYYYHCGGHHPRRRGYYQSPHGRRSFNSLVYNRIHSL